MYLAVSKQFKNHLKIKCVANYIANRRDKTVSEATEVAHEFELIYTTPLVTVQEPKVSKNGG